MKKWRKQFKNKNQALLQIKLLDSDKDTVRMGGGTCRQESLKDSLKMNCPALGLKQMSD